MASIRQLSLEGKRHTFTGLTDADLPFRRLYTCDRPWPSELLFAQSLPGMGRLVEAL